MRIPEGGVATDGLPLILASRSPRRRELLALLDLPFETDAPEVDEHCSLPPDAAVAEIARRKARRGAELHPGRIVIGSDTLVAVDGRALGKPEDPEDAARMLRSLSGRTHQVYTGVCVIGPGGCREGVSRSDVTFLPMTEEDIRAYIATGEPMDKAGAYALQGRASRWIDRVDGSPSGVIGLPVALTARLLNEVITG